MYSNIIIDDSGIQKTLDTLERAKAKIKMGINPPSGRVGTTAVMMNQNASFQPSNRPAFLTPMKRYGVSFGTPSTRASKVNALANSYGDPSRLSGLTMVEESADFMKIGYINRGTRTIMSAIPGMNDVLYGVYRARAIGVEAARGVRAGEFFSPGSPYTMSGQSWINIKDDLTNKRIWNGRDLQGRAPAGDLNLHPLIAVALSGLMLLQLVTAINKSVTDAIEDETNRLRGTLDTMDEREFLRWAKADRVRRSGHRPW